MRTLIGTVTAILVLVSPALAADGGIGSGTSLLIILFLGFAAVIIVFQFIPGLVLFFSMLKGLFSTVAKKAPIRQEKN